MRKIINEDIDFNLTTEEVYEALLSLKAKGMPIDIKIKNGQQYIEFVPAEVMLWGEKMGFNDFNNSEIFAQLNRLMPKNDN